MSFGTVSGAGVDGKGVVVNTGAGHLNKNIGGLTLLLGRTGLGLDRWPMAWFVVSVAGLVGWAVIYALSLLVAWYPESRLVE